MITNKDKLIINQILSERNRLRNEKNINPDMVFIHPDLLSKPYSSIGGDDPLKVFESKYIEKNRFILSVEQELGSIKPF